MRRIDFFLCEILSFLSLYPLQFEKVSTLSQITFSIFALFFTSHFVPHFLIQIFLVNQPVVQNLLFLLILCVHQNCADFLVSLINFSIHLSN